MRDIDNLVTALRADAMFQRNRFSKNLVASELEEAADTLEALHSKIIE